MYFSRLKSFHCRKISPTFSNTNIFQSEKRAMVFIGPIQTTLNVSALYLQYSQFWHISLDWKLFKVGRFSQLSQIQTYFNRKRRQWSRTTHFGRSPKSHISTSSTRSSDIFLSPKVFKVERFSQLSQIQTYFNRRKGQWPRRGYFRRSPKSHLSPPISHSSVLFLSTENFSLWNFWQLTQILFYFHRKNGHSLLMTPSRRSPKS